MARRDRALPYFLSRFGYWHLDIACSLLSRPGWTAHKTSLAQEAQKETRANVDAILSGHDNPQHPEHRPDLRLELDAMQISAEPDERIRALRYWVMRDRLWYENGAAWRLLHALPARQRQALEVLNQQLWAPPSQPWTWDTLLPGIARDQTIFQKIIDLGATRGGVAYTSDPTLAQTLYGQSKTTARKIYVEYSRQTSVLLGLGALPRRDWAKWLRDAGGLNRQGRMQVTPFLADVDEAYHWFAHALRNLARYRNADPPLPWPDNSASCQRRCLRDLARLAS